MDLLDYKFNEDDFTGKKMSDLSDTPSSDGMTAEALKAYFDYIPKTMIALGAVNKIIDLIVSSSGAKNIGASVSGVAGTQVQAILESVKSMLDDRYTKSAADGLLDTKADRTTVNAMVKSISFNKDTGVFTITEQGGTVYTINTILGELAVNFRYDKPTQSLIITNSDGSTQTVSLSDFVTETEIKSTETIAVTDTDGVITLNIKSGSITDDMLSSTLLATIQGYVQSCASSATSAESSATNARDYSDSAAESASAAIKSKNAAGASEQAAAQNANAAAQSALSAADSASSAQEAKSAAENARDEAREIAGGHYVTETQFQEHTNNTDSHTTQEEKDAWNNKVDKVEGKELSSNDYTSKDKEKVDNLPSNTNDVLNNKVDKVAGKDLSTEDYTTDEKNKLTSLNAAIIVQTETSVPTTVWVIDNTHGDYPWRAIVPVDGCTANHIPEVTFALSDAISGNLAPIAETYDGVVCIYAKNQPSEDIIIPTIKLTKVVN